MGRAGLWFREEEVEEGSTEKAILAGLEKGRDVNIFWNPMLSKQARHRARHFMCALGPTYPPWLQVTGSGLCRPMGTRD